MKPGAGRPEGAQDQAGTASPELSRGKTLLFSALILALFFGLCEGLLALAGVSSQSAHEDPYVGFASHAPLYVEERDAGGSGVLTTARNKLRFFNAQSFAKSKAPGTRRAFCIGGSTTYGRPYDDRTSFCGWLREMLRVAALDADWEIVNAGGISYASYRAARVMEEVAAYEPDLFIIYSGHNEFLENRTYATIRERNPALVWADSLLSGTRIYSALRSSIGLLRDASSGERSVLAEEVSPVLDQSIGPDAYTRDDVLTKNVLEHYRFNLDRMLRIAEDAGADAILVTPASNLKDCSPFKSEYSAGLTEDDRLRFSESLERGRRHLRAGELDAARHELATAVRIDPRRADAHYLLGRALLAQNEGTAAERELRQAIDEDVCPLRALSPIRGIVREVAQLRGTALIDFAALLEDAARREFGDGIPGEEYFLDHVHPTIEGNRKLALALVDVMAERDWIDLSPGWNAAALDAVTARVRGRIDRNEQGIALRNLAKVLSWAGKSEDAAQLARRSLALLGEDAEDSFILGAEAAESGRHDEAARHYRDAIRLEADYVKAWNNLGISLVRTGRDEEAIEAYREALHLAPAHASARFNLANALQRTGQFDAAIAHYRELVRMSPEDADAHFNLARAYERQGELALAVDHYRETLEITPGDEDAHHALAELQNALGRSAEADAHFAKSDSIDSAP